jgi:hypothetical protein
MDHVRRRTPQNAPLQHDQSRRTVPKLVARMDRRSGRTTAKVAIPPNLFQWQGTPEEKQGPNQNWHQGQGSGSAKNSNAMDLTPGHIRARGTLTEDEHAKLMATGGCFRCRKQGHMSWNCPDKPRQSQARGNQEDKVQIQATNTSKKPFDAKGLIEQIKELNDEDKDIVIQEVFMKNRQDFS